MFPDEFWVQLASNETFTCPFCTGTVSYNSAQDGGQCMECMSLFRRYAGIPRFFTDVEPRFEMIKVWAEKGELVVWIEQAEEKRRVLHEAFLRRSGNGGKTLNS